MLWSIMKRESQVKWLKVLTYVGIYGGLLIPLIFVPKVIFPFVFSKLAYFQLLIGLTFPAYLALAWMEPRVRPRWLPLSVSIGLYFVALGLSTVFAVDPLRAWWGNQERMNGLFTVFHFFLWFLMTSSCIKTWAEWRKIIWFEIALSVIGGCVSLLQLPFPRLLSFPAGDRVGGLLDNPIYMAAYQIFNLFFIGWLWLKGESRMMKILLVIAGIIDIGAFVAAQSRGALLGLAVGLVVFAVVYGALTSNKKARITVFSILGLFFVSYGLLFALRDTAFVKSSSLERFTNFQTTTRTRFIAWEIAWQGFLERPLVGWGYDDFHILFNQKYNPESLRFGYYETWFDRSHNTVMDALAMTGLFGFLAYVGIFGTLVYSVVRANRKGILDISSTSVLIALPAAYVVQNLFVFDQPAGFTMSFFLYAMVVSLTAIPSDATTDEPRPLPVTAFGILQVCALLVVWRCTVLPVQASMKTIESNNYFSAQMYDQSLDLAIEASKIPTPYQDEQTFLQSRNMMTLVEGGTLQNVKRWKEWHDLIVKITNEHLKDHPNNTHPHFIFARFLDEMSASVPEDAKLAEEQYKEAIRTSPKRQQIWYSYGRFLVTQQRPEEGNKAFITARDFDPNVGESWWYVGISSLYDLKKPLEGAMAIASSTQVSSPYQPKNVREALAMAEAFELLNDHVGMNKLWPFLPQFTGDLAAPTYYLNLARIAEKMNEIKLRDPILNWLTKTNAEIKYHLAPLKNGSATSIDASFKMTPGSLPTSSTPAVPTATTGSGPRR